MLVNSCNFFKLPLHLYGQGEPWPGLFEGKIKRLRREVETLKSTYILVCDSSDTFVLGNKEDLLTKFLGINAPLVVSAEKNCWPQPSLASYFPKIDSQWCYLNSGGYMGRKEDIVSVLDYMSRMPISEAIYRSKDWENDQFRLSLVYVDSVSSIKLDTRCELFQTMGNVKEGELEFRGNMLRNLVTNTYPLVVHYNGHTPGMREAFSYVSKFTFNSVEMA